MGLKGKWSSLKFPSTYTAINLTEAKLWQANLTRVVGADLTKAILEYLAGHRMTQTNSKCCEACLVRRMAVESFLWSTDGYH